MANRWQARVDSGSRRPALGIVGGQCLWRRTFRRRVTSLVSRRIALVEDEPALRANVGDALRRHGYEVAAFARRDEALDAFRTRLPDLALIDIGLADDVDGGF